MFWKRTFLSLSMAAVGFAADPSQEMSENPFLKIEKKLQEETSSSLKTSVFQPHMSEAGAWLLERKQNLASKETLISPSLSVEEEMGFLKSFWSGYKGKVATYCQTLFQEGETQIARLTDENQKRGVLERVSENIGLTLFVADKLPKQISSLINLYSPSSTQRAIFEAYTGELEKIVSATDDLFLKQKKGGIQDPEKSIQLLEAEWIAEALITHTGRLNLGIIPLLKKTFTAKDPTAEYILAMDHVLSSINPTWQSTLDEIIKPREKKSAGNEIVRNDLNLDRKEKVTDIHAKVCALKALLSQTNQQTTSDCLTLAWGLKKQDEYLLSCLKDYGELIHFGYLSRSIEGKEDHFFFLNTLEDSDLTKPIILEPNGQIGNSDMMFWQTPGIASSLTQMGIKKGDKHSRRLLKKIFNQENHPLELTAETLIHTLASSSKDRARGIYGFSITQNRLLKAWEHSLTSMREEEKGDYIKTKTSKAVSMALKEHFACSSEDRSVVLMVQKKFYEKLNEQFRFVFDAATPLKEMTPEGKTTEGGFICFERSFSYPKLIGKRVESPKDLKGAIKHAAKSALADCEEILKSKADQKTLDHIKDDLLSHLESDQFLNDLFHAYDVGNVGINNPVENYEFLAQSPLVTLCGENPYEFQFIETDVSFASILKPHLESPYALTKWVLDLAKWHGTTEHYYQLRDLTNLSNFQESFEQPMIRDFILSHYKSGAWINQKMISPNLTFVHSKMDSQLKHLFSLSVFQWVETHTELNSEMLERLNQFINNLNQKEMTVEGYLTVFHQALLDVLNVPDEEVNSFSLLYDALFLNSLPFEIHDQITLSALCFSRIEWQEQEAFLCVFLNPRTKLLDFGILDETRSTLLPISENECVDAHWEVAPFQGHLTKVIF